MNCIILCLLTAIQFHIVVSSQEACGPKGVKNKGVSQKDIRIILKYHNRYRLKVARGKIKRQPKGLNLYRMKWDKQLAKEAQRHAEECKFIHHIEKDPRFKVGQNLYMKFSSRPINEQWNQAVTSWFREHKDYRYSAIPKKKTSGPSTGHYTQVIWAKTHLVGCGFAMFIDNKQRYAQLYVCNYGPAGNMQGQAPYEVKGPNKCPRLCHAS